MKVFLGIIVLVCVFESSLTGRHERLEGHLQNVMNDAVLTVEPLPPDFVVGECVCKCCKDEPPIESPCSIDVVVVIDNSACFRDYHGKMMRFLKKLIRRIGRTQKNYYGDEETRLALMQFSSDIIFPLQLSDFEDYTDPASNKKLMNGILDRLSTLRFLGEGSFLDKALNRTAIHFQERPRRPVDDRFVEAHRVAVVLTNGNSHPNVTMEHIEASISGLEDASVSVIPVAVSRECHGIQTDSWNVGLCPNTVVLNKLAKLSGDDATFLEMSSLDTQADIIKLLEQCKPPGSPTPNSCNNCTCSCELPVGPEGRPGPRGLQGDFVKGDPGEKGRIGPKGNVGRKGFPGVKGTKGDFGEKGREGPKGNRGDFGPKGSKGFVGDKGEFGPKGTKGQVGPKGDRGRGGDFGPKGSIGPKGNVGDKGKFGDKGMVGVKGIHGPPGPRGPKGFGEMGRPGTNGNDGLKGKPGDRGLPGGEGPKGDRGCCGTPGPAGRPGEAGSTGEDGSDGQPGFPGGQGPRGDPGRSGSKGGSGEPGIRGLPGVPGLTGGRGLEGPRGPRGPKGEKGEPSNTPGPVGLPGTPGSKGQNGDDGRSGRDGRDGPPGRQGPRGPSGDRGPPGELVLDPLRLIIIEIIRELLPGECSCVEKPEVLICREYPIDVTFLLDGSDSIDRTDFDRIRNWTLLTVDAFEPSARKNNLVVSVVQFSERSQIEIQQEIRIGSSEIAGQIQSIEQMRSGTKTYSALDFVNKNVYPRLRSDSYKILITMTDGDASEDRNEGAIDQALDNFNMMVAVGVGRKVDETELMDFSSTNHTFTVENFGALEGIISSIIERICTDLDQAVEVVTPISPAGPGCTSSIADLAFVLDGSTSVGKKGFALLRAFLINVVREFQNIGANGIRISIIQYSDNPRLELAFEDSVSKRYVMETITSIEYMSGNTRTGAALSYLNQVLQNSRPEAREIAVIITDGKSQDDVRLSSQNLRGQGVTMFAIGVGEADVAELREIASLPQSLRVFNVQDFAAISSIKDMLVQTVCNALDGAYTGSEEDVDDEDGIIFPETGNESTEEEGAGPDIEASGNEIEFY